MVAQGTDLSATLALPLVCSVTPSLNLSSLCIRVVPVPPRSECKDHIRSPAFPPLWTIGGSGRQRHTVNASCGLANLWDQRGGWADLLPPPTALAQRDATPRARPVRGISGRPPGDTGVNPVGVQLPPAMARWATSTENRDSHPPKVSARSPNHRKNIGLLTSAKTQTHGSSGVHHWGGAAWRLCPQHQGRNKRPEGLRHRSLSEGALSSRRDPSCSSTPKWLALTVFLWNYHCASLNKGYGFTNFLPTGWLIQTTITTCAL